MTKFASGRILADRPYLSRRLALAFVLGAILGICGGIYAATTVPWLLTASPTTAARDGYPQRAHVLNVKLKKHGRGE